MMKEYINTRGGNEHTRKEIRETGRYGRRRTMQKGIWTNTDEGRKKIMESERK